MWNRNINCFAVTCFACKTVLQYVVKYLFINWYTWHWVALFSFGSGVKQEKINQLGCFTNLGCDKVGKAKILTNYIARLRSIVIPVENWLQ